MGTMTTNPQNRPPLDVSRGATMMDDTPRRRRRRRPSSSSSSSSLVLTATAVFIAGVAFLTTCCQADLVTDGVTVSEGSSRNIDSNSGGHRRTRGSSSSSSSSSLRSDIDINDNNYHSTTTTTASDGNDKPPKTFLIKFKDGLAQTRSLEIHHNSRRQQRQLQQQLRRETRGEEEGAETQGQPIHHPDRKKWQSRAKSISSISEERHIAIVEMMDSEDNDADTVGGGASSAISSSTSSSAATTMFDELMADEDIELVEEDFLMYKYSIDAYFNGGGGGEVEEISFLSKQGNIHHAKTAATTATTMQKQQRRRHGHRQRRQLAEAKQYGIDLTQSSSVWAHIQQKQSNDASSYPNTPIRVCIIDTGYDVTHEDLPKKNITGTQTTYGDYLVDGDGHGTHVAGVIGAIGNNDVGIVGVNPDPRKFSFHISKALNRDGFGTASSVLKGIRGCIDSGSKIITMSLGGGPESNIFRNIYEEAYDKGILSFAAAGNLGLMQDDFPASYPTVVSVGAADDNGNRASFSNWNSQLELMGPGVNILSTYPDNAYGSLSGTSMATPFVAGVAALIWGYFPKCSNQQIRNVMAVTAKAMAADGSQCDRKTGFGLVQAKDAFDLLDTFGCEAGGNEVFDPPSLGGVGGCDQPLVNLTKLSLSDASFVIPSTGDNCQQLMLTLLTDGYAYETSWELTRVEDGVVMQTGPSGGDQFEDNTMYRGPVSGCLDPGTYEFTISDEFGDGLNQPAYYALKLNGNILVTNSKFGKSETTSFIINATTTQLDARQPDPAWIPILSEGFDNGFGQFFDGGTDAAYVDSRFGRNGLVMVKSGHANYDQASIYSDNIQLGDTGGYSQFMVALSYYASNTGADDGFCLDYQANGDSDWAMAKCWENGADFENRKWYDDESFVFITGTGTATSISIRFRGFSADITNRIFIDKIELFGSN